MIYITNIFEKDMTTIIEDEYKNSNVGEKYLVSELMKRHDKQYVE